MPELPSAQPVSLRTLLAGARFLGADDIRVVSCSADSRRCRRGDLFVAVRGSERDGHDFVEEARRRGAVALLAERPLPDADLPTCLVPDSRDAFARLCQALAGHPSQRLNAIGITGTNGKTTTSYLAASVLEAGGHHAAVMGTLGGFDGVAVRAGGMTTPGAPVLAQWLARSVAHGCSHAVMEVSSHGLSQARVAGIEFDVACVTNIRHDHLDFHGCWDAYRSAKARLLEHLLPEGLAVLNADDPATASLLDRVDGPALTIGIDQPAEITATPIEQSISEQTFLLSAGCDTVPVRTPLVGKHNLYNCLVAAAVGLGYGLELEQIARGLEAVAKVPGRLERIECGQPFAVFVDYAHTPDALAGVLQALREMTPGRLICVFGAGGNRDKTKRPRMGQAVEAAADWAIVTSDNPRHEDPRAIIGEVLAGFKSRSRVEAVVDRAEAIGRALTLAERGDCVLIAGKGHERFQQIGELKLDFDDREFARQWLYEFGNQPQPGARAA